MFYIFFMFLHDDVMNHRFITKIDELMNLFINRRKSLKMQRFVRFITFSKKFISSSKIRYCDFVQKDIHH